jgi:hypothetical protein
MDVHGCFPGLVFLSTMAARVFSEVSDDDIRRFAKKTRTKTADFAFLNSVISVGLEVIHAVAK